MTYEVIKPEGAPEWFKCGIKCRVKRYGEQGNRYIVWYDKDTDRFLASDGAWWPFAEPIEKWTPKYGEDVVCWDEDVSGSFAIGKYSAMEGSAHRIIDCGCWRHIARLLYDDGRVIDVTGGIEAIKGRTDWL